eukprot:4337802-Pleurochrysis_carterae.AAC.6
MLLALPSPPVDAVAVADASSTRPDRMHSAGRRSTPLLCISGYLVPSSSFALASKTVRTSR